MKIRNSKLKIKNLFLLTFLVFLFLSLATYQAQAALVPCGYDINKDGVYDPETEGCQLCHLFVLLNNIWIFLLIPNAYINNNLPLIPIVAVLMLVIGGFYFLIAGPSPERVSQAKSIITTAVIGLLIIFVAWIFLNTFLDFLGLASWTGTWWQIQCQ